MKGIKKLLFALVLFGITVVVSPDNAKAEYLMMGEMYSIDIDNDGKKESIYYTTHDERPVYIEVYIDEKKVYEGKNKNSCYASVMIEDIDTSDKYKDVVIKFGSESDCFSCALAGNYVNKQWKLKYTLTENNVIGYRTGLAKSQPGKNIIRYEVEFSAGRARQGYVYQDYTIGKHKVLKPIKTKTLNTTKEWRQPRYRLTKSMMLRETPGDKNGIGTLKKGTEFSVYKIKCRNASTIADVTHIYIKTKDGKEGWIKIPSEEFLQGYTEYAGWCDDAFLWG